MLGGCAFELSLLDRKLMQSLSTNLPINPSTTQTLRPELHDEISFVLRLARALHSYGVPAHRLEDVLESAARKLGLEGQFFSTPTSIFAAFGPQDAQHTFLIRVNPGAVDLGKLAELDAVAVRVLREKLAPSTGSAQIDEIIAAPSRYGSALTTLAFGLASAAASRFLGGGWKEIGLSAILGWLIGLLMLLAGKQPAVGRVFEPVAAFSVTVLAAVFSLLVGPYAVSNATLAGLIVLMPGLTLTVAITELSTQHLASGTARLSAAFVVFLSMGFGVAIGETITRKLIGAAQIARADTLPAWTLWLAMMAMSLALTVLLRAKARDAVWIVISGALAFTTAQLGARWLGAELGVFVGALTIGIASRGYAQWLDRPALITQVPGLLLLVPGSVGFRGLAALLDKQVISGIDTTFKMTLTAVALVAGTLIANILAPMRREI
jgi:uncharacterized membrane protein YjjP (DUF1212 family)